MHLQRLEAINFRNLSGALEFEPGLNFVYGQNAQGKTSWLEAAYLLATTKSFRTAHPKEGIRHGVSEAVLRGTVQRGNLHKDLQMLITATTKQSFVNGKREAVTRYLGNLDAIAFTADELEIVRGAPDNRRRFVDRGLVSTLPSYLGTLTEYGRVLKQKNALLREASEAAQPERYGDLLQPWNDQLVALGTEIHTLRSGYVAKLQAHLNPGLFQHEAITVRYKSALEGRGDLTDYAGLFRERLTLRLKNEIAIGYSLVGPHRDDLEVLVDGYELAKYGSSGQQRSALLILDLAQLSVYHSVFEEYPLFLIDDIDAELDRERIGILLDFLKGKAQTLVSTSKHALVEQYQATARRMLIDGGRLVTALNVVPTANEFVAAEVAVDSPIEIPTASVPADVLAKDVFAKAEQHALHSEVTQLDWSEQIEAQGNGLVATAEAVVETAADNDTDKQADKHRAPF